MKISSIFCLTGGPGGGKTRLIEELIHPSTGAEKYAALPEAIRLMGGVGVSPQEKLFQRAMVHLQMALEDGMQRALKNEPYSAILCHRGSLDPLAYWIDHGWREEEFFAYTGTSREDHYQRYTAVLHLVTAAEGAEEYYTRWPPHAHRPETSEEAIHLDHLLHQAWRDHPHYYRIDNQGRNWDQKAALARNSLSSLVARQRKAKKAERSS